MIARPGPGHHRLHRAAGGRTARCARGATRELPAAFPPPGLGGARPRGDLDHRAARRRARRWPRRASPAPRSPPSASPTSARPRSSGSARPASPIHRAIVWQCRRTADAVRRAEGRRARAGDRARRPGLVLDAVLLRHQDRLAARPRAVGARARAERGELAFGTVDTLARVAAHGRRASTPPTPPTPRARSAWTSAHGSRWDDEMLARLTACPREVLARRWSTRRGPIRRDERRGRLPAGVPIAGIAGDQQAALFGQALLRGRHAPRTPTAPAASCCMNTGEHAGGLRAWAADHRGLAHRRPRRAYALEGSVFIAGAAVQWLRDGLGIVGSAGETRGARRVRARHRRRVLWCRPSWASARPYWDPYARGTLVGLTRGTTARAPGARHAGGHRLPEPRRAGRDGGRRQGRAARLSSVDGGAVANNFLCQFQADVLDTAVLRPARDRDRPAMGAALPGRASAAGFWTLARRAGLPPVRSTAHIRPAHGSGDARWPLRAAGAAPSSGHAHWDKESADEGGCLTGAEPVVIALAAPAVVVGARPRRRLSRAS
mgnify:CR=1 FL=1